MGKTKLVTNGNIHSLLSQDDQRFDAAIEAFRKQHCAYALTHALNLIDEGYARANLLAGYIYELGCGEIQTNVEYAFFYYKQAVDKVGAVEAWLALGRLYFHGKGIEQDFGKAFECYIHVYENRKDPIACLMLGKMYHAGLGVQVDYQKARSFYTAAAISGNIHAINNLGLLEQKDGHCVKGILLRLKAISKGFVYAYKNDNDPRLRRE